MEKNKNTECCLNLITLNMGGREYEKIKDVLICVVGIQ